MSPSVGHRPRRGRASETDPSDSDASPVLDIEEVVLRSLGLTPDTIADLSAAADDSGLGIVETAIAAGLVTEEAWTRALAVQLGVRAIEHIAIEPVLADSASSPCLAPAPATFDRVRQITVPGPDRPVHVFAVGGRAADPFRRVLDASPQHRSLVMLATRATIRRSLIERFERPLLEAAVNGLALHHPTLSAARPLGMALMLTLTMLALAFLTAAMLEPDAVVATVASLFLPAGLLRLAAAWRPRQEAPAPDESEGGAASPLGPVVWPRYAVLVPVYRETAATIEGLVAALDALDYPRHRLDIRIIAEADDTATVNLVDAAVRGTGIELVRVPPGGPRTKPKALAFVLGTVVADLVTVYDAEDRPEPDQLKRAARRFEAGSPDLVALQAALVVDHHDEDRSWFVRQFEMEYAALFLGLLPHLARLSAFLPLGGSSNHFRYAPLVAAGGWDPFNVTEDADLSVRLVRFGGRIGTFDSRTREEAPVDFSNWLGQRVRWFKGWIQTFIVHAARPGLAAGEMGIRAFLVFLILIGLGIASALMVLPAAIAIGLELVGAIPIFADRPFAEDIALAACVVSGTIGWGGSAALALAVCRRAEVGPGEPRGRRPRLADLMTMPLYWGLMSIAAWIALIELCRRPHHWRKTAHGIARRSDGTAARIDDEGRAPAADFAQPLTSAAGSNR